MPQYPQECFGNTACSLSRQRFPSTLSSTPARIEVQEETEAAPFWGTQSCPVPAPLSQPCDRERGAGTGPYVTGRVCLPARQSIDMNYMICNSTWGATPSVRMHVRERAICTP